MNQGETRPLGGQRNTRSVECGGDPPISNEARNRTVMQPFEVGSDPKPAGLIFKEGLEKRQPNGNQSNVKSQKEERT